MDMWTDIKQRHFVVITAHDINKEKAAVGYYLCMNLWLMYDYLVLAT